MNASILLDPPIQSEIIQSWNPARGKLVSVCMLVYNHAPYLRDALNSILNQKTDFGFEILVHDDASQDASAEIIKEYAARYPEIIKPILQSENQHSQGIYPSVHFNYPRAKLPFVAMCEGDDHWADENKLQTQIDGLLENPEINLSFHSAYFVDDQNNGSSLSIYGDYGEHDCIIPFHRVLHRVRGWIPLASCVIRQEAKQRLLSFLKARKYLTVGEIYFQFFGALPHGALYYSTPMSFYRYRTTHSWTRKLHVDIRFKAVHETAMIRSYHDLNNLTNGLYKEDFTALTLQRLLWLFNPETPPKDVPGVAQLEEVYANCETKISDTLRDLRESADTYIIFGCASGCTRILKNFDVDKIVAIVDRDNKRIGESMAGKPIIGTDDLSAYGGHSIIVSTIAPDRAAILELARTAGIQPSRVHYLFDRALDYLAHHPISPEIFVR